MHPDKRVLMKVMIEEDEAEPTRERVEQLMGKKAEHRFAFIQEQTSQRGGELLEQLDV